jgi:hypothetical protein
MTSSVLQIEATNLRYYSQHDEDVFFQWLDSIACVEGYRGHLRTLYIRIAEDILTEEEVREFVALYHRYNLDMTSLIALDLPRFASWFHDKTKFWHDKIFSPEHHSGESQSADASG